MWQECVTDQILRAQPIDRTDRNEVFGFVSVSILYKFRSLRWHLVDSSGGNSKPQYALSNFTVGKSVNKASGLSKPCSVLFGGISPVVASDGTLLRAPADYAPSNRHRECAGSVITTNTRIILKTYIPRAIQSKVQDGHSRLRRRQIHFGFGTIM
ncbi:Uncharacterised protein r2_g1286 [Pycnogonum litorale]